MNRLPFTLSLFTLFLVLCGTLPAQTKPSVDVGVYSDEGTWEAGIIALEHFLDWKGLSHERVDASVVNADDLRTRFRAILFPGGYAYDYKRKLTARGEEHVRELVSDGGAYIGICAGAYFAATTVEWEGGTYPYSLGLFRGTARGSLSRIAPWPGFAMTPIALRKTHPVNAHQPDRLSMLYYGGPSLVPEIGFRVDTIALWESANGECAVVSFSHGSGRVLLLGPHPEIEENDGRDGSDFGAELFDPETDWGFLWACFDWVLGRPVTDTLLSHQETGDQARGENLVIHEFHPNPARDDVSITLSSMTTGRVGLSIVDLLGRTVRELYQGELGMGRRTFHFRIGGKESTVPAGLYFVRIVFGREVKIIPLRLL